MRGAMGTIHDRTLRSRLESTYLRVTALRISATDFHADYETVLQPRSITVLLRVGFRRVCMRQTLGFAGSLDGRLRW